jgi:hypothetical protein
MENSMMISKNTKDGITIQYRDITPGLMLKEMYVRIQ